MIQEGEEVVKVEVTVNNNLVFTRFAAFERALGQGNVYRYKLDDGGNITHNPSLGYKELAQKMLTK